MNFIDISMESKKKIRPDVLSKNKKLRKHNEKVNESGGELEGYPEYPPGEDIYKKFKEEIELNPEDPSKPKVVNIQDEAGKADHEELSGEDLDIPGAELDDDQEILGTEDEENNYYSLGGDNHENLEENNG